MTYWSFLAAFVLAQLMGLIIGAVVGFAAGVWWGARNVDIVVEEDR